MEEVSPKCILCIDPGLNNIGIVVFDEYRKIVYFDTIKQNAKLSREKRFAVIYESVEKVICNNSIEFIITEWMPANKFDQSMIQVGALVSALAGKYDIPARYISPLSWKKSAFGSSKVDKEETKRLVGEIHKEMLGRSEHENDAAGMFLAWLNNPSIGIKENKKKKQNVGRKKKDGEI
jgi:Holliday junction resolvasome RuvABC endonuclease subunit